MKSIGIRFPAITLCVVFLGLSITVGAAVAIMGNGIKGEMLSKVQYETKSEAADMNGWLGAKKANLTSLADVFTKLKDFSEEQQADIFGAMLEENPDCFEVYMGYPDGRGTTGTGYVFDYSWWSAPERGWYQLAMTDTTKTHVTSPYTDANTGELCITVCRAVYRGEELLGVVATDIFLTTIYDMTMGTTLDAKGYAMLLDANGDVLVHPDEAFAPEGESFQNLVAAMDGAYAGLWEKIEEEDGNYKYKDALGVTRYYTSVTLGETGWRIVSVLPESVVTQPMREAVLAVVPIALAIVLLTAVLIYVITKKEIILPIKGLVAAADKLAMGGIDVSIHKNRDDEIGSLTDSFAHMIESTRKQANLIESLANGDFTTRVRPRSEEDVIGNSLAQMSRKLSETIMEIQSGIQQVTMGSRQIADGSQSVAQGSSEQSASIKQLVENIEALTVSIDQNVTNTERASSLSAQVRENAETGNERMEQMLQAVKEINEASNSIEKVIHVIEDIAFQTNILALNAAVEAARAGVHGKGFAVVAEEVRNLAAKSAEAAKDTSGLIINTMEKAVLGEKIAGETSASLREIIEGVTQSAEIVSEISHSGGQQAESIGEVRTGLSRISDVVQQNSASAQESAATSEQMSSRVDLLGELVAQFKVR